MNETKPLRYATVIYRRPGARLALALPVIVPDVDDWMQRVYVVAKIVAELHFHYYDFEAED